MLLLLLTKWFKKITFAKVIYFFSYIMFKRGSKLYSIFNNKCPKCHTGDFFYDKSIWKISKLTKTHEHCSHCNLKYMIEPSFYFGAMYVNYGISVAISIATFIIMYYFFNTSLWQNFVGILIALIITMPISLKLSRLIWINMFVAFDKKYKN